MNTPAANQALYEFRMALLNRLREATIFAGQAHPHMGCRALRRVDEILAEIDTLINDVVDPPGQRKRDREETEAATRKRVRELGMDDLLMETDHWNQSVANMLAHRAPPVIMAGTIRIAIRKFLNLLDRCPPEALEEAASRQEGGDIDSVVTAIGGWRTVR